MTALFSYGKVFPGVPMESKEKILVVDDDLVSVQILRKNLMAENFDVSYAVNGEDAIEEFNRFRPDIVLLDLCMPGIDGIETCRRLKKMPGAEDVPIIFISSNTDKNDRVEALSAGAVDFVSKPFQRAELFARLSIHIKLRTLNLSLRKQSETLKISNEKLNAEICDRKHFEERLEAERKNLDLIFDSSPIAMLVLDSSVRIVKVNSAALVLASRTFLHHGDLPGQFFQCSHMEKDCGTSDTCPFCPLRNLVSSLLKSDDTVNGIEIPMDFDRKGCMQRIYLKIGASPIVIEEKKLYILAIEDVSDRKIAEMEKEKLILELQRALEEVKTLKGLIPICASCKKIRDDEGIWNQIESYVQKHSYAQFSHGICPECMKKLYPQYADSHCAPTCHRPQDKTSAG